MKNKPIGRILLREGAIDESTLEFCLSIQRNNGGKRLGEILRHYDFVREELIIQALAEQIGWPVFKGKYEIDEEALKKLGLLFFRKHTVYPVRQEGGLIIVMSTADNMLISDHVYDVLGKEVNFALASATEIMAHLSLLEKNSPLVKRVSESVKDSADLNAWFEHYLHEAIELGATDIHIEPSTKAVQIRLRVDGLLRFHVALPLHCLTKLINVIFHKADVTVSDFGRFHDARFSYAYMEKSIDIRLSHIPSVHGSSIVLRLLDKGKTSLALMELGYGATQWARIEEDLIKPEGIMLIVGPTGSGKSTSLYAMINHIKHLSRKIISIEDPVEMHVPLVTQVQINEKRGIHFHESIRAFLRHDPDVMLVGEIRDEQTACESMRASMTGHKVFATLHARRGIDALLRLHDLGVPWINMANNITTIMSQRLVRKLCRYCRKPEEMNIEQLMPFKHKYLSNDRQVVYVPVGCCFCSDGYNGRTVISEILKVDESFSTALCEGNITQLMHIIKDQSGFVTLAQDVGRLVQEGITSLDEAVRVLG